MSGSRSASACSASGMRYFSCPSCRWCSASCSGSWSNRTTAGRSCSPAATIDLHPGSDCRGAAHRGAAVPQWLPRASPARSISSANASPRTLAAWLAGTEPDQTPDPPASARRRASCSSTSPDCAWPRAGRLRPRDARHGDRGGTCTALGHTGGVDACGARARQRNRRARRGFRRHVRRRARASGAVIVPAVLAACEREGLGRRAGCSSAS